MLRFIGLLLLSLAFLNVYAACDPSDKFRPLDVIAANTNALLQKSDFKTLEQLATQYKNSNAFASDGQPSLMGFYSGLSRPPSNCKETAESDEVWNEQKQLLIRWSVASPNSSTPKIALAELESRYGWHARGGGYASTVTTEGWKLFTKRSENARIMLEALQSEATNDPQWYASMLDIALAQGWDSKKFDATFDKAIKRFPFYYEYYFIKGRFYSEIWHGSQAEFKGFVEQTVKSTAPRVGQSMYARLNWSNRQNDMFTNGQTDWKRMKKGFEKLETDFPDDWNRNNFAKFACMAEDVDTLKKELSLIGNRIAIAAWDGNRFLEQCKAYAKDTARGNKKPRMYECWRQLSNNELFCQ